MIYGFDAGATLFRSGWFVESLATQTLVIFLIRTRRIPFFHSRPSRPLLATTLACVGVGVILPYSPLADVLGFEALPLDFLAVLALMVVTYLALVELGKYVFFTRLGQAARPLAIRPPRASARSSGGRPAGAFAGPSIGTGAIRIERGRPTRFTVTPRGDLTDARPRGRSSRQVLWGFGFAGLGIWAGSKGRVAGVATAAFSRPHRSRWWLDLRRP